jgi:hypothetical protein
MPTCVIVSIPALSLRDLSFLLPKTAVLIPVKKEALQEESDSWHM